MHRRPVVRDVGLLPHESKQVIRGEDRVPAGLGQALLTECLDVGVGAREHAEVPETLLYGADRVADRLGLAVLARGVVVVRPIALANDPRLWQERTQMLLHAERAGARATRPVRRRERLVDVDVDAIEPEVTRSRYAEQRVHVRAVAIDEAARVMDGGAHLADALLEEPERVRVREHEPGDVRPKR